MIEITGNDIKELNDTDLRSLIGLLCEAELRSIGVSTSAVTWGGNQNATDGGIDVRVELTNELNDDSFIPRSNTGFQVKKTDMPRSAIFEEMRPNNELRQSIKELSDIVGAYIIVSSQGSTADSVLRSRKAAMIETLADYPNTSGLKIDFYDRDRVASWVRTHPSLILWVRDKIGRPIQGWKAYGNWVGSPNGDNEEYKMDEHIRLRNMANPDLNALSAVDGINELRNILNHPRSCIRLVGLSGVGKTRLLQALFDKRIGESPLNQSRVFYSDISDSPNPDPRSFAERIISLQIPTILLIDNCPPELHRRLTSVCSASGSLVSLITVEYDVRDDQPEETEVYRLEPASTELIEKVISARFSHVSQVDTQTIAEFSGGNARIAIALAKTIQSGESLGNLRDDELFQRLFLQRHESNNSLLRVAEVCSLVYSFDCQTNEGSDIELKLLGSLIGMDVHELYRSVGELKRRELMQQRSIWRAILPHAIANKLAIRAFENIPLDFIINVFENESSQRLLISFSRRLSFLHKCNAAKEISRKWLSEEGLLYNVSELNELGISLFNNIAPINPELTLSAIERLTNHENAHTFFSRENVHFIIFTRILRSIAYDKSLFERAAKLLCRFALTERPDENNDSIRELLKSLFYIHFSGTHASTIQRLEIISTLLGYKEDSESDLGIFLLDASLESLHFIAFHGFEFGARSRDYGFSPASTGEVQKWFELFLKYTVNLAISDHNLAIKAKVLLAEKFEGLWIKAGMYDELEDAVVSLLGKGTWKEGWIAVKTTMRLGRNEINEEIYSRLNELAIKLEPTTLSERSKLFALSQYGDNLDLIDVVGDQDEETSDNIAKIEIITRSLGHEVGENEDVFMGILPAILSNAGDRLFSFGLGLASGSINPLKMWNNFCDQLSLIEENERNYQVLRGFLNGINEINANCANEILNQAVTHKILSLVYPILETSIKINNQGLERLRRSLELGLAPVWQYRNLAYGSVHVSISDDNLSGLIRLISTKKDGVAVSIEILKMRLHQELKDKAISKIIVSIGQELLLQYQFLEKVNNIDQDYGLSKIIEACLADESAKDVSVILCDRLIKSIVDLKFSQMRYNKTLKAIAIVQPVTFLDSFLIDKHKPSYRIKRVLTESHLIWTPCQGHLKKE